MTLREAQFSLRQIGMDGRSLVAITAGRVPQDMRDALAEPRATYIASHHPNVARRMVDMATLAAVATITDTMASARPVLEKAPSLTRRSTPRPRSAGAATCGITPWRPGSGSSSTLGTPTFPIRPSAQPWVCLHRRAVTWWTSTRAWIS